MIPRIKTFQVKNYKSLASVSVDLEPLTIFVGANGSGKSNLLDALAFVQECVVDPPEKAVLLRGGMTRIMSALADKSGAASMGFRLCMELENDRRAEYTFHLTSTEDRVPFVGEESCVVWDANESVHEFHVQAGRFIKRIEGIDPVLPPGRLALSAASATSAFRPVYDFVSSISLYAIDPSALRREETVGRRPTLDRDGNNAVAVLKNLREQDKIAYETVTDYLTETVPGLRRVYSAQSGTKEILMFLQQLGAKNHEFEALSMSDGALRTLGLLLAVFQVRKPKVLMIEEPELTVHPALAEVLFEILRNAAEDRQVLVTTHSADILDHKEVDDRELRLVSWKEGGTRVTPISKSSRQAIRERLYSAGDLLRVDELSADPEALEAAEGEADLFGEPFSAGA